VGSNGKAIPERVTPMGLRQKAVPWRAKLMGLQVNAHPGRGMSTGFWPNAIPGRRMPVGLRGNAILRNPKAFWLNRMTFPRHATDAGFAPSCMTDNSLALELNAMAFALNAIAFSLVDPERIPPWKLPAAP
jgi:hypothetical protein